MSALADLLDHLRCPICAGTVDLTDDGAALRCPSRHSFDVARQGYVALLDGRSGALRADTAEMVSARLRVHDAGFLTEVVLATASVVADLLGDQEDPVVIDLGGGPGVYMRACVRRSPQVRGIVFDLSKFCVRAVVRAQPASAGIVADVWRGIPMPDACAAVALSIFAPRNIAETARVLRPGGHLVIVTPQPDHLRELIAPLGMLSVAPDKDERLIESVSESFEVIDRTAVREVQSVGAATIADLVAMGPSAFHHDRDHIDEVADAVAAEHGGSVMVTCAVTITTCRLRRR